MKIDEDNNGVLDSAEIGSMAQLLNIKLTDTELAIAMDEMGSNDGGVGFETFTNWWLGPSKIAAKIKTAGKVKDDVAPKIFKRLDRDKNGHLEADDFLHSGRAAFGQVLSSTEAREIIDECIQTAGRHTKITQVVFETWWKTDMLHASRLRRKRQDDIAMTRRIIESFDTVQSNNDEDYKTDIHARLDRAELQEMNDKLKLGTSTDAIIAEVARANDHADVLGDGSLDFVEFFDWLVSDNPLAMRVKKAFLLWDEKAKKREEKNFPFIPFFSVQCRDLVYWWAFDNIMTGVVLANTMLMMLVHHEQDITYPNLSSIMDTADAVFSIIYLLEIIVKLFGMGGRTYFSDNGNKFDFACTAASIAGLFLPELTGSSSFRSLRVLIRCMRVARSAKVLLRFETVQMLLMTVLDNGDRILMLGLFAVFMLVVFSIIGGHSLGNCHVHEDGSPLTEAEVDNLPLNNYFTFIKAFHSNFFVMTNEAWSEILFDYEECSSSVWMYFVLCSGVMNYFTSNLFVALIVDGFCLSVRVLS